MPKMPTSELKAMLTAEKLDALAAMRASKLSSERAHAMDYYNGDMSRDTFEEVLGAMARAGLVQVTDAVFEKNGKQIPYRKVSLTRAAYSINETKPIEFIMKEIAVPAKRKGKSVRRTPCFPGQPGRRR